MAAGAPRRSHGRTQTSALMAAASIAGSSGQRAEPCRAVLICPGFLRDYTGEESTELSHNLAQHLQTAASQSGGAAPAVE
ncbi:hypothetical protein MNEG_14082, partial [Monoraphidium neglectum]